MTESQVRNIALETFEYCMDCINYFKEEHPTMKTKEVAKYLGMSKEWVQKNKVVLGGKRSNKRGDLRFRTDKILDYKLNKMQL